MSEGDFISRWSRRKIEARKGSVTPEAEKVVTPVQTGDVIPASPVIPAKAGTQPESQELPPIESLTPESDFSPFMKSEVDPKVRRDALKTLFQDPRHNVMDGLDVYIDDYSKPDPLPDGWLEKLNVMAHLGDQPAIRKEAEEKAAKALELEQKNKEEQPLTTSSEAHPDGAAPLPSPSPESKDYPPGAPG